MSMLLENDLAKRKRYLQQLLNMLPPSAFYEKWVKGQKENQAVPSYQFSLPENLPDPWLSWLEESGELPPDFDTLPDIPHLTDLTILRIGEKEASAFNTLEWQQRREKTKASFFHWILGGVPPAPEHLTVRTLGERKDHRTMRRWVQLTFGPDQKASLRLELIFPEGDPPFSVFMTQSCHRIWASLALSRGYLCCVYAAGDIQDDTDTFMEAYPEYDWSRLTRRAWAASRCVDYLLTLPEVNHDQIALMGHSRNGKQSLIASALDERITCVVSSSSGTGGALPFRYVTESHFGESIELITRFFPDWFHPRLRFFVGREHKLPVDMHELVALCAPRPCLLSVALNDPVESTWAMQQTYLMARRVYRFLGAEDNLQIMWREGGHEINADIIGRYLDWCNTMFGRASHSFQERLIHPCDWEAWRETSKVHVNISDFSRREFNDICIFEKADRVRDLRQWEIRKEEIRTHVLWMLGDSPPMGNGSDPESCAETAHNAEMLWRNTPPRDICKEGLLFGEYVHADIYLLESLKEENRKLPAVLWLHPFSFPFGYVAAYPWWEEQIFHRLARKGFVVFCFDQIGFGGRIKEAETFYHRYPQWSLLGKMVRDSRLGLQSLQKLPYVDKDQIWGLGYCLGAQVGLHLGILEEQLAGFISVCGPQPFRLDSENKGTGGIRLWSHLYQLLPKMGFFIGEENRLPYDIHHLIACYAPRPVLVVSPQYDRMACPEDISLALEAARDVFALYGSPFNLEQIAPESYNNFGPAIQNQVINWLESRIKG